MHLDNENLMFECNSKNCILSNDIDDVLKNCALSDINLDDIELFGLKIKIDKINENTIHHLFSTIRKYSDYLRNTALTTNQFISTFRQSGLKLNCSFLRKQVISTLSLFKHLLNHKSSICSIELKKTILNELKFLLLSINRISNLPELIYYELFSSTSNKQSPTNQLFHHYLDVWWNVYLIYKSVHPMLKDGFCLIRDKNFTANDACIELRSILLSDLITISFTKFNINHLETNNYRHLESAFACSCIKLIYVLIYLESTDSNEFWNSFNRIIDQFAGAEIHQIESMRNFQLMNRTEPDQLATLWLISNLSDLFQQIEQLNDEKLFKYHDNNIYVCNIVKILIKRFEESDSQLNDITIVLKLCMKSTKNLNIDIVMVFFDFFMKNLNASFQLNNIKNMQILPKSGHIWYQKLICYDSIEVNNEENINQLFYFLIFNFVKRSVEDNSTNNNFQKFKGRLYSKLQAKKIEEFKDIGVYNLLNIFIIISYASKNNGSIIDILNKFLFVVKVIKNKSLYSSRMIIVLKSLFCFNYFLINNQDLIRLNEIIVELFNEICDAIPSWSLNNIQVSAIHNAYFELVNVYCNEILDYVKNHQSPDQTFGNLFKCKFNCLMAKLSERETLSMVQFINNLMNQIKFKIESDDSDLSFHTGIYELLSEQFIDFLRVQMKNTISSQISNVVYEFMYMNILLSTNEQNFKHLIDSFLFNKSSNIFNIYELIIKTVNCETIFSKIFDVYYDCNLDRKLMEIWFQIAITVHLPYEKFDKLTKQLSIQFPIFKSSNSGLVSIQDVFCNLSRKYQLTSSCQDKIRLSIELNQCLTDMINRGKNILKDENTSNDDTLNQLYVVLSYLVQNCCSMIHVQGNNTNILPQLLETFYNPNFIQSLASAKVQSINNCIRRTLPNVLDGLATLHSKSHDPYIDRKLKNLFIAYIPLFMVKGSTHPLIIELTKSRNADLFFMTLHYIKDCLFIRPPVPSNPALTVQFIQFANEFYLAVRNVEQKNQIFKLFPLFLDKMLTSEELTKRKIRDLLTSMVNNGDEDEIKKKI